MDLRIRGLPEVTIVEDLKGTGPRAGALLPLTIGGRKGADLGCVLFIGEIGPLMGETGPLLFSTLGGVEIIGRLGTGVEMLLGR